MRAPLDHKRAAARAKTQGFTARLKIEQQAHAHRIPELNRMCTDFFQLAQNVLAVSPFTSIAWPLARRVCTSAGSQACTMPPWNNSDKCPRTATKCSLCRIAQDGADRALHARQGCHPREDSKLPHHSIGLPCQQSDTEQGADCKNQMVKSAETLNRNKRKSLHGCRIGGGQASVKKTLQPARLARAWHSSSQPYPDIKLV